MNEISFESALAVERQRILADLHDGLGISLVGLLQYVRSGQTDTASIERRVREALLEMRIAVDALRPNDGRLDTVLGNLRSRLDETIRGAGMHVVWNVEALPPICGLEVSAVFSIQRIVLEAITNALKHSGGRHLAIMAHAQTGVEVEIRISDDGLGFDASQSTTGLGLANMRARAHAIGARLQVSARYGAGTSVCIALSCQPASSWSPPTAKHSSP